MKKLFLLLLLTELTSSAQTPSSCVVPQQLADSYYRDVRQLATNYLYQNLSPDTALVTIPQSVIDPIIEGMAAILNAQLPESDSVYNLYCVHNNNGWPIEYDGFLVSVDTNYSWTQSWQNLVTLTGDPLMDTIITRYDLHITNFYNWSFGTYALISTDSAWNPMALIDTLEIVPGVLSAEQNLYFGLSGTITYTISGNDRIYEFYFEFNDCFDGCDNYRKWTFSVDQNCAVTYLGFLDFGAFGILPLPTPVNCNLFTSVVKTEIANNDFNIFPNPARDFVTLYCQKWEVNSTYELTDISGRTIRHGIVTGEKTEIDIHGIPGGIYFLKVSDNTKQRTLRLICQD